MFVIKPNNDMKWVCSAAEKVLKLILSNVKGTPEQLTAELLKHMKF